MTHAKNSKAIFVMVIAATSAHVRMCNFHNLCNCSIIFFRFCHVALKMANQKKIKEQTSNNIGQLNYNDATALAWRYYWLMRDAPMRYLKNYYKGLSHIYCSIAKDLKGEKI